jgi:predicted DsbA family dithiol-disulfide isomerase
VSTIIDLGAERARRRPWAAPTLLHVDLASPWTYLAAPAAAQRLPVLAWVPVLGSPEQRDASRPAAEARARELGVRFVWPRTGAPDGVLAARVAALAADRRRCSAFTLAATRLAFGWGRDLDSLDVLAEAAGAADIPLDDVLDAVFDPRCDEELLAAGRALADAGADRLPALRLDGRLLSGEAAIADLATAAPSRGAGGR